MPFKLNYSTAVPFFFILFFVYLAGIYFGTRFLFLFLFMLFLPIFSAVHLFLTAFSLRFNQDFSTEHPVKGEAVHYTVSIAVEMSLPGCRVDVRFKQISREYGRNLQQLTLYPNPREPVKKKYSISCPFRGIYTVGMESLEVTDLLGWLTIRIPVWYRTFYVFPRLVRLDQSRLERSGDITRSSGIDVGSSIDYTISKYLTEYRPNASIRHIAWKKFAATGTPFTKVYDQTSWPGITIYLDTRRLNQPDYNVLEAEDCSVEIIVAMLNFLLTAGVPVYIRTGQWGLKRFYTGDASAVERFIHNSINLYFKKEGPSGVSPATLLQIDVENHTLATGHVLLITHLFDAEILSFMLDTNSPDVRFSCIMNFTAMDEDTRKRASLFVETLNETAPRGFIVEGPRTIEEDLSRA